MVSAINTFSYQWQLNVGSGFNNIATATQATLTLNNITTTITGYQYRVLLTGGCGTVTSAVAVLTVNPLPVVTLQLTTDSVNQQSPSLTLAGGLPVGGVYEGTGVSNNVFMPAGNQPGDYTIKYTFTDLNGCANSATDVLKVLPAAGSQITIFPNPSAGGSLNIVVLPGMVGATLKIYDYWGRAIEQWVIQNSLQTYQVGWEPGVYLLEFTKGDVKELKKVIIVR